MCVYCATGDEFFKSPTPPIWPYPQPQVPFLPMPVTPPAPDYKGWNLEQLRELLDLLERIKKLEDAVSCPCEASKADYIGILRERVQKATKEKLEALEKRRMELLTELPKINEEISKLTRTE